MRADRLISILMLLQVRGRFTARQLAEELEVSERTIYRDMLALNAAGIPVYSEAGPKGGFSLLDSYRTTLTGLSSEEAQAIFMMRGPEVFKDLGIGHELKGALLKLAAALPEHLRSDEAHVRDRFYLDPCWWQEENRAVPHLKTLHRAVWEDRKLEIVYEPIAPVRMTLTVAPYALVSKGGAWYLIFEVAHRMRVIRISDLLAACTTEEGFRRREDFDLERFWQLWVESQHVSRRQFTAQVRISAEMLPYIAMSFGQAARSEAEIAVPDEDGSVTIRLQFESLIRARNRLLGYGRAIEVLSPQSLRLSIQDIAEQITKLYRGRQDLPSGESFKR